MEDNYARQFTDTANVEDLTSYSARGYGTPGGPEVPMAAAHSMDLRIRVLKDQTRTPIVGTCQAMSGPTRKSIWLPDVRAHFNICSNWHAVQAEELLR